MSTPSPDQNPRRFPTSGPAGAVDLVDLVGGADDGTRHLLRLTGEVDDELRLDLEEVAAEVARRVRADPRPVHVDATAVTFMDSSGAAFLARLAVSVRPTRVSVHPSEPVAFLLDVTRLSDVVDVVPAGS